MKPVPELYPGIFLETTVENQNTSQWDDLQLRLKLNQLLQNTCLEFS